MNAAVLFFCLLNLGLIGALPRVFFRPGKLNLSWWATAGPFFAAAGVLAAGVAGVLAPALPASPLRDAMAVALCAGSVGLIGFTLGTHREPLSLWHQEEDAPERLVTWGAYARVRHPFYLSFLLALLGCAAAFPHAATLALFLYACVRLDRTAAREERRLLASAFGAEYVPYLSRTGRFLPRPRASHGVSTPVEP